MAFLVSSGLLNALQKKDWAAYARGYNGPDYAKNSYDTRLAKFYSNFAAGAAVPDLTIRAAQLYLLFLGFNPQGIDGQAGAHTLTALHNFQSNCSTAGVASPSLTGAVSSTLPATP